MKPMALAMAVEIGKKNPAIVQAAIDFRDVINSAGGKYLTLVTALREAKLLRKEATLLLLGLGFTKGRASELNTLSTVKDEVWAKYSAGAVGFRAALQLEAGKEESSPGGTQEEGEESETPLPSKPRTKKIHDVAEGVKGHLNKAAAAFKRPLKGGVQTEYAYAYQLEGVNYYFAITASPKS